MPSQPLEAQARLHDEAGLSEPNRLCFCILCLIAKHGRAVTAIAIGEASGDQRSDKNVLTLEKRRSFRREQKPHCAHPHAGQRFFWYWGFFCDLFVCRTGAISAIKAPETEAALILRSSDGGRKQLLRKERFAWSTVSRTCASWCNLLF